MTAIEAIDRAQLCGLGLDPARALAHGIKLGREPGYGNKGGRKSHRNHPR